MSAKIVQLDLFMDELNCQKLAEHEQYKLMTTKSIRRLFAELGDVGDVIMDLKRKLDALEGKGNG